MALGDYALRQRRGFKRRVPWWYLVVMPFLLLLLAFVLAPLAEIYVLIRVGSEIGALPTIALCLLTAAVGAILIRLQGITTALRIRAGLARGEVPALEMLAGVQLVLAGALLMTPGFVTDSIGFVLLVPAVRRHIALRFLASRAHPGGAAASAPPGRAAQERVIEGEYRRLDD